MSSLSDEVEATEQLVRSALARLDGAHPFQRFFSLSWEEVMSQRVDPEKAVIRAHELMDHFWPSKQTGRSWREEPNELIRRKLTLGEFYVAILAALQPRRH